MSAEEEASKEETGQSLSEKDQQQLDADKVVASIPSSKGLQRRCVLRVIQKDPRTRGIRLENEKYLRSHPELAVITTTVIAEVLRERPEDPVTFVANYMTAKDLKARVLKTANTIGAS
eukprot:279812-Rhodomonas_salina.2